MWMLVAVSSRLGFEGVNCELDIDECALRPNVCQNDGLCKHYNNTYTFKCFCGGIDYEIGWCGYGVCGRGFEWVGVAMRRVGGRWVWL